MKKGNPPQNAAYARSDRQARDDAGLLTRATRPLRAAARAAVFFLKVFPMLPSRQVDWVTKPPVIERVSYPSISGPVQGEVYRPAGNGPYPGILVCLGVVPFGVDHPQVPVLGNALARAGFAALLYWSPSMREFCLNPDDVENLALVYKWLIEQPTVDPARSGLLGTCVGGGFTTMSAASSLIREQVSFLAAYAPFSSMETFARDIASSTRNNSGEREPWQVDQLTRKVFLYSLTSTLAPAEAELLRSTFTSGNGSPKNIDLSQDGKAVCALLEAQDFSQAEAAMHALPASIQERLAAMSPLNYLKDIHAPLIVLLHDRGDQVIPVGESRRLRAALGSRPGVHYTEMQFSHLDPAKGKLPFFRLVRELGKFLGAVYPLFRHTTS